MDEHTQFLATAMPWAHWFWWENRALQIEKSKHHYRKQIFILNHWAEMLTASWRLEDTLRIIDSLDDAFINKPQAASLWSWMTWAQGSGNMVVVVGGERGGGRGGGVGGGGAGSCMIRLPAHPRSSQATLCSYFGGTGCVSSFLSLGHSWIKRKGNTIFRVEEIINFQSYFFYSCLLLLLV